MELSPNRRAGSARAEAGFTLIEIMVVIVILGGLFAIVAPRILGSQDDADIQIAKMDVKNIHGACLTYYMKNKRRIPGWDELLQPDKRGNAYIEDQSEPKQDPWGNEYVIGPDPEFNHKPFVYSFGPDGQDDQGEGDDISNKNQSTYGQEDDN